MIRNKKVIFEKVTILHYPILLYYLWCKCEVFVFDFDYNMKRSGYLRYFINREIIKRIYIRPNVKEHGWAIEETENIYDRVKNKKILRIIAKLYNTTETDMAFKKVLLSKIFMCIYINEYLRKLEAAGNKTIETVFVADTYIEYEKMIHKYGGFKLNRLSIIKMPRWCSLVSLVWNGFYRIVLHFAGFLYLLLTLTRTYFSIVTTGRVSEKKHYRFGIPIDQEFQVKFKGTRSFDFLLDHEYINRRNTVFILRHVVSQNFFI